MSQSASHWAAFAREVAKHRRAWTVRDDQGFPQPLSASGVRAQPFWSSLARVQKIIETVPAYSRFRPHEISWEELRDRWLPGLAGDGVKVGVNWTGPRAVGYDLDASEVRQRIEYELARTSANVDTDHQGG